MPTMLQLWTVAEIIFPMLARGIVQKKAKKAWQINMKQRAECCPQHLDGAR